MPEPRQPEEFWRVRRGLLRIARESVRRGEPLPGEYELARLLDCGRGQVRRVMGSLEYEGIVNRHQGTPTQVDPIALSTTRLLDELSVLEDQLVELGYTPATATTTLEFVDVSAHIAQLLDVTPQSPGIRLVQTTSADGIPSVLTEAVIAVPAGSGLPQDRNWTPERLAEHLWSDPILRDVTTISAARLTGDQAARLALPADTAVTQLDIVGIARSGRRPYRKLELYRPDLVTFSTMRVPRFL